MDIEMDEKRCSGGEISRIWGHAGHEQENASPLVWLALCGLCIVDRSMSSNMVLFSRLDLNL